MRIVNLTQHVATPDQIAQGVVALDDELTSAVNTLLTFDVLPSRGEIVRRADLIADIALASGAPAAMIGGAPYLMALLESALRQRGVTPLYAFSQRKSIETVDSVTGQVTKATIFTHLGFVDVS